MTLSQTTFQTDARQDPFRWERSAAAQAYADFADPFHPPPSQRQYAKDHDIPRSTLGDWQRRPAPEGVDPALTAFLRCPAGEAFLSRLILAVLLVFHKMNACGLRPISLFLHLLHIDRFVGASYGALQPIAARLQADLAAFGDEERLRMAPLMLQRAIALIPDENFHGAHPCLVAIEPVSNFILVEAYAEHRDSATWKQLITQATQGLHVSVAAVTADQATGIIACAGSLDAHYTPELFHSLRDLGQPLFGPLQRQTAAVEKELAEAQQVTHYWKCVREKAETEPPQPGPPADFEWRILLADMEEDRIKKKLRECQKLQEQTTAAVRGIGDDYHPFDSATGNPLTAEQVQQRLDARLKKLERVADDANLGKEAHEAFAKGKQWFAALVASMAWFWALARKRVEELSLPEEVEKVVCEQLLSGLYWQQAAKRARTAEERQDKHELAQRLLKEAWAAGGPLARLAKEEKEQVQRVAQEIVGLFARSSSCVEGRNGRLSLLRHGHTRLSEGQLKALTVVHNYVGKRPDGSTAAERFFGVKQRDAFAWLLGRMQELPHPAAPRPDAKKTKYPVQTIPAAV
jgi:hypothetical protein